MNRSQEGTPLFLPWVRIRVQTWLSPGFPARGWLVEITAWLSPCKDPPASEPSQEALRERPLVLHPTCPIQGPPPHRLRANPRESVWPDRGTGRYQLRS